MVLNLSPFLVRLVSTETCLRELIRNLDLRHISKQELQAWIAGVWVCRWFRGLPILTNSVCGSSLKPMLFAAEIETILTIRFGFPHDKYVQISDARRFDWLIGLGFSDMESQNRRNHRPESIELNVQRYLARILCVNIRAVTGHFVSLGFRQATHFLCRNPAASLFDSDFRRRLWSKNA